MPKRSVIELVVHGGIGKLLFVWEFLLAKRHGWSSTRFDAQYPLISQLTTPEHLMFRSARCFPADPPAHTIDDISSGEFAKLLDVNVVGYFRTCKVRAEGTSSLLQGTDGDTHPCRTHLACCGEG